MNGKVNSTGGSRFEPLMNTEDFRTSRTERESGGMSLELGKLFDVPQRSSSITDKLSNLLSSFGTKIKQRSEHLHHGNRQDRLAIEGKSPRVGLYRGVPGTVDRRYGGLPNSPASPLD